MKKSFERNSVPGEAVTFGTTEQAAESEQAGVKESNGFAFVVA